MKTIMQYANASGLNWANLSKDQRDRLQTHLSMNSLKTVDPINRSFNSRRSGGGSRKSKGSAQSCSSRKSNRQEWDYNGHRVKSSTQKSSIKKKRSSRSISAVTRESKSRHSRTSLSRNSKGVVSSKSIGVSSNRSKPRRGSAFMHS